MRHWILPFILFLPSASYAQDLSSPERRLLLRLELAVSQLQVRDFLGAAFAADQAIAEDPANARAYVLKATALNRMERFEDAEEAARRAAGLEPGATSAYDNLSWAQLNLGRAIEATDSATYAIALRPDDAQAYAIRAYAFAALGNRESMISDLRRAAELAPAHYQGILDKALERNRKPAPRFPILGVVASLLVAAGSAGWLLTRRAALPGKVSYPKMSWTGCGSPLTAG